jgi:hypothetical protein
MKLKSLCNIIKSGSILYVLPHYYSKALSWFRISLTPPVSCAKFGTKAALEVHMLSGKKHRTDCIFSAKSFLINYPAEACIIVHADESIDRHDMEVFKKHIPNIRIFPRAERDELVIGKLRGGKYEKIKQFRRSNIFGAKLIDAFLLSNSPKIVLLDSDCIAFKRLTKIVEDAVETDTPNLYSRDPQKHPYSISNEYAHAHWGGGIAPGLCAGFCMVNVRNFSLDKIEELLSAPDYPMSCHFAEQTVNAFISTTHGYAFLSSNDYNTGRTIDEQSATLIHYCGHYLGKTRIRMRTIGHKIVSKRLT